MNDVLIMVLFLVFGVVGLMIIHFDCDVCRKGYFCRKHRSR